MKVLGLDSGMTRLGIGAIKASDQNYSLIAYGMLVHPRNVGVTFNQHLNEGIQQIVQDLPKLVDQLKPDLICGETVPVGRLGSNTELVVAAITTCKVIAFQFGIPWKDIAASTVKKQTTGDGRATKIKVRNSILEIFPQVEDRHSAMKREQKLSGETIKGLYEDVFDGIAIALAGAKLYGNENVREMQEREKTDSVLSIEDGE